MAALTNYLENKIIDHLYRGVAFSPTTTRYFALFTSAPTEAGGGTEVSGGSYARVGIVANTTNFAATDAAGSTAATSGGTSGTTSNNVAVTFPAPTANWGVVSHMAIMDSPTGGNMWSYGALSTPKTINNGDSAPSFAIAAFTHQIDD